MYFDVGTHVHITCNKKHYDGEITHIVVKDVDGRLETILFLRELSSKQQSYGNACFFLRQIEKIRMVTDEEMNKQSQTK